MADQNDPRAAGVGGTQVPDLIERYRMRRDEWIAQADELARLRDEVRGAAEREAMEIVTAARRDVRQVIMEARRELLVLSAQVQAALGEVNSKADPGPLLTRGSTDSRADTMAPGFQALSAGDHPADIFVPEAAVKTMLDEARADMEALAEDARTVPFQATILAAAPEPEEEPVLPEPSVAFESLASLPPPPTYPGPPVGSRVLLSSTFPSDAVAVPPTRSIRTFVSLFVIIGALVLGGSIWWLRSRDASPAAADARPRASEPASRVAASAETKPTAPAPLPPTPEVSTIETQSGPLSLVVEARRSSWIRTTLDGQSDVGRTYAAGETVRLNAKQGVSLRVGDAGAVYVSVNKGEAKPLGRDGEVITRQFVVESKPSTALASAVPNPAPIAPAIARGPVPGPSPSIPPTQGLAPPPPNPTPILQPAVAAAPNAPAIEPPPSTARATPPPSTPRPETTVPLPRTEVATAPAAAPPAAATAIIPQSNSTSAVVAAARQWLDAYHRQERSLMTSLSTDNMQLADERRADERFPATVEVNRTLEKVSVQIAADTAVLTAVMTESTSNGQRVSPISQVWVLSGGQWRVRQVRLVSEARLNQIFR